MTESLVLAVINAVAVCVHKKENRKEITLFSIYPRKYLTIDLRPKLIPQGYYYMICRKSTGKFNVSFRRHYLYFLAPCFPLKNFTLPDGLTTRWYVNYSVTWDGNLERIDTENICP